MPAATLDRPILFIYTNYRRFLTRIERIFDGVESGVELKELLSDLLILLGFWDCFRVRIPSRAFFILPETLVY